MIMIRLRFGGVLSLAVVVLTLLSSSVTSGDVAQSGWHWPTGSADFGGYLGWLGYNPGWGYHLAQDMRNAAGSPVYSIGNGEVLDSGLHSRYGNFGSGPGGALLARYQAADGTWFTALYGHLDDWAAPGPVFAGQVIGYTRADWSPPHLHFGIHVGFDPEPSNPWRGYTTDSGNTFGFVDPISFLDTHPASTTSEEIEVGEREDHSIDPLIVDCYNRNGGAAAIGTPTNYVHQWGPGNNGWIQDFGTDKAITHKTQHTYAVHISGAIWDLYKSVSGPWSSLGWPLDDAISLGNGYNVQQFELGYDGWISDAPYWGDVTHDGIVNPPDTYSPSMSAGEMQLFQLKIKNYGQETWPAGYVGIRIKGANATSFRAPDWSEPEGGVYIAGSNTEAVPPQGTTVVSWHMQAPVTPAVYTDLEVMLYSLDGQCYVPNVMHYDITVGGVPTIQVGELADHTFDQKFVDCYNRNGGAAVLGQPTSYVEELGPSDSLGWVQHFGPDDAILRKDKSYALAAYTYGPIWRLYSGLGGPAGPESSPIDWPYWRDPYDYPYPSNPANTPPGDIIDHPIGPVYQSYMVQSFLDTVPYDGWICEAPFWGDKTHDGIAYPFDTYSPTMVAGQTERFRLMVKNYGQETWQPRYVLVRIKGTYAASFRAEDWWEPVGDPGVLIAGSVNEAVPPQGMTMLEWYMKAPTAPGLYGPGDTDLTVMLYSLDGRCYVANVMHYHVTVVAATPGPDYAISELRRTDGSGERVQGDTIDLSWETRNQGTLAGTSPTTTTIYLSSDATITTADIALHQDTVPALAAGATQARTGTLTIPFGILPAGWVDHQYHIGAICDRTGAVGEINEGNNVAGGARLVVREGSTYSLTVAATDGGTVSGIPEASSVAVLDATVASISGTWQDDYAPGTDVPLQADPADGYIFLGWKWDHADPARTTDVTVDRNRYVTANFALSHLLFSDVVAPYDWAEDEIASCYYAGIVQGYTQDDPETAENEATYAPGLPVTRDQMAVYIVRGLVGGEANVPPGPDTATFPDVPDTFWAYDHIEYAVSQNVVKGHDDGLYHPDWVVTRDQMAAYVGRAMVAPGGDAAIPVPPATATFPDVPSDFWAYKHIEYCADPVQGVVNGYEDGLYHPEIVVTRDQMAVYVARAFQLPM